MNLYLLTQESNNDYDTFDSCIVASETEEEARLTHPNNYCTHWDWLYWLWFFFTDSGEKVESTDGSWTSPENVEVKLIGKATEGTVKWVILSSFNAG